MNKANPPNLQDIFDTQTAVKFRGMSDQSRAKMLATKEQNPYTHSPESKDKIRTALKGQRKTAEHGHKISAAKKGQPRSAEASAKTRATLLANPSRVKPIQTPWGLFAKTRDAVAYAKSIGIRNPRNNIMDWLHTRPTEFYFVAKNPQQ